MTNVDDIINGIDTLNPIPPVAMQIMALAEDESSSTSDIADLIVHDPSITASLLKICNSAFFGLSRKLESFRDAAGVGGAVVFSIAVGGALAGVGPDCRTHFTQRNCRKF